MHWKGEVWDFPIPSRHRKSVRLSAKNRRASGAMNNPVVHQGACAWEGYQYFPCGFAAEPTFLTVNHVSTGQTWCFPTDTIVGPYEPEGVCGWNGGIYVSYAGQGKDLYIYRFELK